MAKGLGAGLGALFGAEAAAEGDVRLLPIARVEPRREQPRTRFDEEALAELAESIRAHGVIQPITVRAVQDGYYQIIAGERRWRAARMAGLAEVPVRVMEADDRRAMEIALVENLQRADLNPAEEARGYRTLMEEHGLTQEETAARVGKSRPVVANALRLLTLPERALDYLEEGLLTMSQARALLSATGEQARLELADRAVAGELTVREIEALIKKQAKKPELPPESGEIAVDYVHEAEKKLSNALGRRIRIITGKKRGKIEIEYYGDEDFEALCAALGGLRPAGGR